MGHVKSPKCCFVTNTYRYAVLDQKKLFRFRHSECYNFFHLGRKELKSNERDDDEKNLPDIKSRMWDHNVSIDGDSQNREEGHSSQSIPAWRKYLAEKCSVRPRLRPKSRSSEGQVEAAVQKVGEWQVDDEHRCCITDLWNKTKVSLKLSIKLLFMFTWHTCLQSLSIKLSWILTKIEKSNGVSQTSH